MTLLEAPIGSRVRIQQLHPHPATAIRLRELGFSENAVVRCVLKSHGNIICEICNTRIGLNGLVARNILVSIPG